MPKPIKQLPGRAGSRPKWPSDQIVLLGTPNIQQGGVQPRARTPRLVHEQIDRPLPAHRVLHDGILRGPSEIVAQLQPWQPGFKAGCTSFQQRTNTHGSHYIIGILLWLPHCSLHSGSLTSRLSSPSALHYAKSLRTSHSAAATTQELLGRENEDARRSTQPKLIHQT